MAGGGSQRSGWAGSEYSEASGHHRSLDDWFLDRHAVRPTDRVVDAGCGSGEFTARLAGLTPEGHVIGVEPDASMLEAARRHAAPNLEFRQGRLQDLDGVIGPAWADLVVSRAVLHWIPLDDWPACYEAALRVLRPRGWFHTESGGAGNVDQLRQVLDEVSHHLGLSPASVTFPDAGVAYELLETAGFDIPPSGVTTVAQRRPFDRDQLLDFIRTQASMAYGIGAREDLLVRFVAEAGARLGDLRRQDGTYDQTFVRLHALCRRPG